MGVACGVWSLISEVVVIFETLFHEHAGVKDGVYLFGQEELS